jgi:hypothetical protein
MRRAAARAQALGLSAGTAAGYVSAMRALEAFAVDRGESWLTADELMFVEFAAQPEVSYALVKRAAAAWRWFFVATGQEPPRPVVLNQTVRHAASRARRANAIRSRAAVSVVDVMRCVRELCRRSKAALERGQPPESAWVIVRDVCVLLCACYGFLRPSDLAAVYAPSVSVSAGSDVSLQVALSKEVLLRSGTGALSSLVSLGAVTEEPLVCPVVWFQRMLAVRAAVPRVHESSWLFCGVDGGKLRAATLGRVLRRVLGLAKVAGTPHSFRCSFSSAALDLGVAMVSVVRQGRWSSDAVFWRHYNRQGMVGVSAREGRDGGGDVDVVAFPRRLWAAVSR